MSLLNRCGGTTEATVHRNDALVCDVRFVSRGSTGVPLYAAKAVNYGKLETCIQGDLHP